MTRVSGWAWWVLAIMTVQLVTASGCATSRGVLDVQVPAAPRATSGPAVRIARLTDVRVFEKAPESPSTPSLRGGEIDDASIKARAIARKRNGYGKALGDILLPEGRTVEQIAREALTRALRLGGLRVLAAGEPGYEEATPLEVDVEAFWAWFSPGFWAAHLEFESEIAVRGDIAPFEGGEVFRGYVRLATQAATTRAWMNVVDKGLAALVEDVSTRVSAERMSAR